MNLRAALHLTIGPISRLKYGNGQATLPLWKYRHSKLPRHLF